MSKSKTFKNADALLADADAIFARADELFDQMHASEHAHIYVSDPEHQTVGFKATNFRERWRLFRKFCGLAVDVLFKGSASIRFKRRVK